MFWRPSGWRTLLSNTVPDQTLAFPASRDPSRFASWRRQPSIRYIVLTGCTEYFVLFGVGNGFAFPAPRMEHSGTREFVCLL
ncbi:hypothetical protein BDP67DRAFT_469366 [Colletotrichum lupini]|nr:hypothetical protein BDP67DRAFT_469366 [Colletotrichum lupini]